ncbi:hypothetical protein E2C06_21690 [Dankookia rubra]|uniref:Uncharacterized protein n=1 Tax=Dankookia rubra TaxID=1442381 RepID=A0A4R5QCG4_9PROT|nr:hypothetical protein [Dankookia rubra]TDH60463.1 hypothetical protein E2C06_21690 [Dankookia rubra]
MARIARDEYPTIQHLVDVEGKKVAEVAASYGCTPANIYAILGKVRRLTAEASPQSDPTPPGTPVLAEAEAPAESSPTTDPASPPALAADLFADLPEQTAPRQTGPAATKDGPASWGPTTAAEPGPVAAAPPSETRKQEQMVTAPAPAPARAPSRRVDREAPPTSSTSRPGSRSGKGTGVALLMRTSDGEETAHPFRSLEELLSASKPILRSAARSSEPIWFSIQQVDLYAFAADDF